MWKFLEGVPGESLVSTNEYLTLLYQQVHMLYLKIQSMTFSKQCQSTGSPFPELHKEDSNA